MDNGFPILDAFNDDQAFERHFGSLLDDASNQLPDLDSAVLDDGDPGTGEDGLDALDQGLFDTGVVDSHGAGGFSSLPSPGGPMLGGVLKGGSYLSQEPAPQSPYTAQPSPASLPPPPSPAQHQFTAPSPAPPQSPAHLQMRSPAPSPANMLYSAKSPASALPPPSPRGSQAAPPASPQPQILQAPVASNSMASWPPLISGPGLVPAGSTVLSQPLGAQSGQMFQLQLQPSVSVQSLSASNSPQSTKLQPISTPAVPITPNKAGLKQPQLLPKPSSVSQQPVVTRSQVTPNKSLMAGPSIAQSLVTTPSIPSVQTISAHAPGQPQVIMGQPQVASGGQPQVIMGQYVQQAGTGQPMLIQQPGSTNMMIIRPGAQTVQAAPTLVPVNGLGAGQFIVQQPNVKLMQPVQGRMQMQKIQTPQGQQLIAVPLAAAQPTFIQGSAGQLLTTAQAPGGAITGQTIITGLPGHQAVQLPSGQIQLQPNISLSSAPIIAGSMASNGSGFTTLQSSGQLLTAPGAIVSLGQSPLTSVASVVSVPSLGALQGNVITQQSVIQPPATSNIGPGPAATSSPVSPTKRKKPKKKRKDEDLLSNKSQGAVDLGALMKDVGLLDFGSDDFGFGLDSSQQGSSQNLNTSLNSSQNSSSSDIEADLSNIVTNPPLASQPPSIPLNIAQISAQTPQLPQQPQFTAPVTSMAPGLRLSAPASVVPPQPQPLQLVQGPDGNFILQTTNPVTGIIGGQPQEIAAASGNLISTAASTISQTPSTSTIVAPAKSSPKPPQRSRNIADANRTPLFDDETLPSGWKRKVSQRKSGASAGRYEVFIIGPSGKRFRSRNELKSFFEKTGENTLNPDDFDFSTFGRNNPIQQKAPVVHAASPVTTPPPSTASVTSSVIVSSAASLVTSAMPSVVTSVSPASSTAGPGTGLSESELIKNLENSAMASVAAARALEVGEHGLGMRNTLLQSIQQPLPPASLSHGQRVTAGTASTTVTTAEQLLGTSKAPPPPLTMPPPSPGGSSKHHPPTPLSADMEDAESQITQLLESLQKQQGGASVNSDQEFFDSLTSSQAQKMPGSKPEPFTKASRFPSPQMPTLTPQMPVLTPQVSEPPQKTPDLQARVKQIVEKRRSRHESGGMPMLSPTTGLLHPASSPGASGVSPVSPRANTKTGGVIQAVPKYSETPAMSSGPPNVTVQSPASVTSAASGPGMGGAGSGSQLRALQQLPPNTRLQHGPNGQIMVQKIQTIELSPTMQQQYKILAQKISLIEQKAVKSPQDEADLAELQAKQHQILSTGRPVFGQQQPQQPPQQQLPQHPAPLQPNVIAPSPAPLTNLVPAPPQPRIAPLAPAPAPVVRAPMSGLVPVPGPAGVPPLTEQQRRIVAEFKTKIAKLPAQEQAAYIAQNKMTLIRQLDFKPNQLKMLQNNPPVPGPPPVTIPVPMVLTPGPMMPGVRAPVMRGQEMVRPRAPVVRPGGPQPPMLQPNIGLLRPVPPVMNTVDSPVRSNNVPTIDRNKKIAWIESQLRNDQKEATQPNYKTPFRSREDTVKRLLRYHVYYEPITSDQEMKEAEEEFERTSERLLERYQVNLSKYHLLMMDESMRLSSSSCEAMLGRMWAAEEKAALAREKEEYRAKFNRLLELDRRQEPLSWDERAEQARLARWIEKPDMPPLPDSWAERYERVVGKSWASYKQQFPREVHTEEPESEPDSPEPEQEIEPEPEKPAEEDVDIKSEPQDQDSDAESFFRERHASSNSDMFSDRCRSRNSSSGTVSSRTQLKINFPMDPSQLRSEFSDLSQQARKAEQSLRPQSSDSDKTFVGLKFNRMGSGRWSASLKRDAAEVDEFSQDHKRCKLDQDFEDNSSDDEDFSLADVGGDNAAVQSMLENDDDEDVDDDDQDDLDHVEDELRFVNNPSRLSLDTFDPRYNLSPGVLTSADSRDNESVNNAIHSILDYDRGAVQTPEDLKNLTGLLDSDSATQNAVNSIL